MREAHRSRGGGGVWGYPPRKILHFMPSKIAADAILGTIARRYCLSQFTSIKHREQLPRRRDSAAKNAAATTVSTS